MVGWQNLWPLSVVTMTPPPPSHSSSCPPGCSPCCAAPPPMLSLHVPSSRRTQSGIPFHPLCVTILCHVLLYPHIPPSCSYYQKMLMPFLLYCIVKRKKEKNNFWSFYIVNYTSKTCFYTECELYYHSLFAESAKRGWQPCDRPEVHHQTVTKGTCTQFRASVCSMAQSFKSNCNSKETGIYLQGKDLNGDNDKKKKKTLNGEKNWMLVYSGLMSV